MTQRSLCFSAASRCDRPWPCQRAVLKPGHPICQQRGYALVCSLFLCLRAASSQTLLVPVSGEQLAGIVSDATGARIPGATVHVANIDTNVVRVITT